VWGGKITTFRKLAEEAADGLVQRMGEQRPAWTAPALLPGGDLSAWIGPPQRPDTDIARFIAELARRHPQLPAALLCPLGALLRRPVDQVLAGGHPGRRGGALACTSRADLPAQQEWARSADDVLWRRTKLGLHYSAAQRQQVAHWWAARTPARPPPCS
jgi:glycerol-3-phosphate dehydrogenase